MGRKQLEIAGTEQPTIKEIDDAAETYVEQRDKRMRLTEKEHEAKEALIAVMAKHNVTVYRDNAANLVVTVVEKANVKVTEVEDREEAADEADVA